MANKKQKKNKKISEKNDIKNVELEQSSAAETDLKDTVNATEKLKPSKSKAPKEKEAVKDIEPSVTVLETEVLTPAEPEIAPPVEVIDHKKARRQIKKKGAKDIIEVGTFEEDGVVYKTPRIIEKKEKPAKKKKEKETGVKFVERYDPSYKVGLTTEQIEKRNQEGCVNVIENKNTKTYAQIFLSNIFTFFNILCITIAIALIIAKAPIKYIFFMVPFTCNLAIGIIQEIKAKKTIEKISLMVSPVATVVRNKAEMEIPIENLVLDDIVVFSSGKQICADCIVLDGEVEVNESLLTGESVSIKKRKGAVLYSGSFVVSGKCYAKVDKVGADSYTAKLSAKAKRYQKPKSELINTLNTIIKIIGVVLVPLSVLTFLNVYHNAGKTAAVYFTAGSTVGMIPAGMFLLTSMALAAGVIKLARKRTLVQDLYSIEMLARADVLCLDKTGTITDGTMKVFTVVQVDPTFSENISDIMGSMLTALDDNNQTSRALALHFGYSKELTAKSIIPFSSARKYSAVTFKNGETYMYGAPEFVLKTKTPDIEKQVKSYAQRGFRVLLLAKCNGEINESKISDKRTPICLIVIEDHIREDASATIQWFKDNGVAIKIISGDNPVTVSEVSKRVGVENAKMYISLEGLSEQQVIEAAEKYTVFGRVSPEQKSILVKALKSKGHKVAMTGDGVNDILALKEADCSIAMASGSEATRNVSSLVLLDSNFSSMPSVVAEGRRVVNNIQNTASLFLMKTLYTMLLTIFYLILPNEYYQFTTIHMFLLEFFVIGIAAFFLALQPNNDLIKGKFFSNLLAKVIPSALIFTINAIACYFFDKYTGDGTQFITMTSLTTTFGGVMVLFTLCKPFNLYRGVLFSGTVVGIIIAMCVLPWSFFGYVALSLSNILFIIILVLLSQPIYNTLLSVFEKIRDRNLTKKK